MKFTTEQKKISLVEIETNPWNPNQQNELIFKKLINSIKENGFTVPILVRKKGDIYQIIDGEHRWKACRELEFDFIKAEIINDIDDNTAKMLTIALNNIKGEDDVLKRAEILKQLNDGQLSILPWDKEEIKNELDLVNFDWDKFNEEHEAVREKKSQTFIFNLTEKEYKVVQFALKLTKKDNNQALLEMVKEYLQLRVDITKYEDVFNNENIQETKDDTKDNTMGNERLS